MFSSNIFFAYFLGPRCLFMDTGLSYSQTFPQDTFSLASLKKKKYPVCPVRSKEGQAQQTSRSQLLLSAVTDPSMASRLLELPGPQTYSVQLHSCMPYWLYLEVSAQSIYILISNPTGYRQQLPLGIHTWGRGTLSLDFRCHHPCTCV